MAGSSTSRKARRSDGFSRRRRRSNSIGSTHSGAQESGHHSDVEVIRDFRSKRASEAEQDDRNLTLEERER